MQSTRAAKQDSVEIEKRLHALERVRDDFLAIQRKIEKDVIYRRECDLMLEALRANKAFTASPVFEENILNKFTTACNTYARIKESLPPYISAEELTDIENSVSGSEAKKDTAKLLYFPTMQQVHDRGINDYKNEHTPLLQANDSKAFEIKANYLQRREFYMSWYVYTGAACVVFGAGLPFLIGGAITHAIDKMITSLRLSLLEARNREINQKIAGHYNPEAKQINERIKGSSLTSLRQGFFAASKERYRKPVAELEKVTSSNCKSAM